MKQQNDRSTRPPDPLVVGLTDAVMVIDSAEAVRRLLNLDFRDAHTALDLTYGNGRFWQEPLPPGILLETNDLNPARQADYRFDFRRVALPDGAYDLVIFDPPHLADGGRTSIMAARFGTYSGVPKLRDAIERGSAEAWRLARVGMLVKVADHEHGGRLAELSQWVRGVLGSPSMVLHTVRANKRKLTDGRWRAQRSPRCNYATYLTFRRDGARHRAWDSEVT